MWRSSQVFKDLHNYLAMFHEPVVDLILGRWNKIASSLSMQGLHVSQLSLFHQGMELPRWLMRIVGSTFYILFLVSVE